MPDDDGVPSDDERRIFEIIEPLAFHQYDRDELDKAIEQLVQLLADARKQTTITELDEIRHLGERLALTIGNDKTVTQFVEEFGRAVHEHVNNRYVELDAADTQARQEEA